jgi:nitrile hydratase subunit beta
MDTIHDLGGRQGFGPIEQDKDSDAVPFHADWEARAYSICFIMFRRWQNSEDGPNLDWFRHARERIDPVDYLTRPYFDQWVQSVAAMLVEEGAISLKELTGQAATGLAAASGATKGKISANSPVGDRDFDIGELVVAQKTTTNPYTRLPGYIRGRRGTVILKHGPQLLADVLALGVEQNERLYTVAFEASELWQDAENTGDRVCIDLWESHLEPAS